MKEDANPLNPLRTVLIDLQIELDHNERKIVKSFNASTPSCGKILKSFNKTPS